MTDNAALAERLMKGEREELKFGDWHVLLSFDVRFVPNPEDSAMKPFRGFIVEQWRGEQTKVREDLFDDIDKAVEYWHEVFDRHAVEIAIAAFRLPASRTGRY